MILRRLSYESASKGGSRLQSTAKALLLLPRSFRLQCVRWQGRGRDSGEPLRATYCGEGESLDYLRVRLFAEVASEQREQVTFAAALGEMQSNGEDGLGIIEINRLLKTWLPGGALITFPWIRQVVDLQGPFYAASRSRLQATYGRRVRQHKYEVHETRRADDIAQFYHALYRDYVQHRFQQMTHARTREELVQAGRHGVLLQIFRGGANVSGVLCRVHRDTITAVAFGLAVPYDENLRRGALSAAYYYLFCWAEARHLRYVDLLRSRPDRADGVFEHKRRWGAEVFHDPWCHTVMGIYPRGRAAAGTGSFISF